jgi:beta-lactamase regulating signal transducer with metallopeptidase domain
MSHVRRRDNVANAIHMLAEALFWFHPLVWWIERRLLDEQERACDEEVLRQGGDPQVYAESILRICEFYVTSPLICVPGITGSDLKMRVREIMRTSEREDWAGWLLGLHLLRRVRRKRQEGGQNAGGHHEEFHGEPDVFTGD